jgi:hypothetical protein
MILEETMVLKRKTYTPQEYIQVGIAFFLMGLFVSMVADGRLIGTFFASLIPDQSIKDAIQGAAAGFSIPISCISIYFNVRGLAMLRSKR